MTYQTALVTGGAGFIGSHLVDALVKKGVRVIVADDLSSGRKANVNPAAEFHKVSITSPKFAELVETSKPDVIFHLAAQIDVRASIEHPLEDAQINVIGTLRLIEAAAKAKVKKIVFSSSGGAIYSDPKHLPYAETAPAEPLSPYGIAKRAGELYLGFAQNVLGVPSVSLRYANVYGPRQSAQGAAGVIALFSARLLKGEPVTLIGTGAQTRDFVYVSDVVEANLLAAKKNATGAVNVGTGRRASIREIYSLIKRLTGANGQPQRVPGKKGEVLHSAMDVAKAKAVLGWEPKVSLEEGLKRTVDWYRAGN